MKSKRLFIFPFLFIICFPLFAQNGKAQVQGRLLDVESGEPLVGANVALLKPDSTLLTGIQSAEDGTFNIQKVHTGSMILKVTYVGYKTFTRNITISKKSEVYQAGSIVMSPDKIMLAGAVVEGQVPEVEVKDDTVQFNAAAFRVPEGSMLEELIKKFPGAEVGSDGSIKINGKTISRIMVDGKEFFGNDRNMAMKNLPTEIVDKVKMYDRKSDLTRITGIDDGEEETVLDLSIKKGMKKGWFGNVDVAAGTEERHSEKLNVNRFTDKRQMSLIGSYNNVNDNGFSGRGGGGETKSGMGGFNFALDLNKFEVGGNVRFNSRDSYTRTKSASQNFISTNSSFSNSLNKNKNKNNNVNGNFQLEWKPDTLTTIHFRPNVSYSDTDSHGDGQSATFNDSPYLDGIKDPLGQMQDIPDSVKVNHNMSYYASESNTLNLNGSLIFNRRLSPMRRNLSIRLSGGYSTTKNNSHNISNVTYFQRNDSTDLTYRYRKTPNWSKNYSAGFTYSEPIAKATWLQLNYSFNYNKRHSDGKTYDLGKIDNMLDSLERFGTLFLPYNYRDYLSDNLSRYTDNEIQNQNIELSLRVVREKYNLNVGVQMQPEHQKVVYDYQNVDTTATRNFFRISPTLNFRYRFSKQHNLRVTYRGNTQQPEITSLFNMTDNSNPLNIRLGNPDLKPSFSNNINVDYNNYIAYYQRSINARLSFQTTSNNISNRTEYNPETGGQITKPMNINGRWNMRGNFGFTTPIVLNLLNINTNSSVNYSNSPAYIYQNQQSMKNNVKNLGLGESLRLTLKQEIFDIDIHGSINYTHTRSELISANNRDTYDFSYGLSTNWNFFSGFQFSTNINMNSRRGYSSAEMNTNELIWNAQVSYRFLKRKQATISLQAYDILNKRSNISRSISETRRSDTETNAIYSYAMLHFIYRVNVFGNRQSRADLRGSRDYDDNGGAEMGRGRGGEPGGGNRGGGGRGGRGGFGE